MCEYVCIMCVYLLAVLVEREFPRVFCQIRKSVLQQEMVLQIRNGTK